MSKLIFLFLAIICCATIVINVFSPRVFANDIKDLIDAEAEKGISWYARQLFFLLFILSSLLMMRKGAGEGEDRRGLTALKIGAFIFFGSPILLSSWLGEVPSFSPYLLSLPLGLMVIFHLQRRDYLQWIRLSKLFILVFIYTSLISVAVDPYWSIDFSYDQSWFNFPIRLYGVGSLPNQLAPLVSLYFPLTALKERIAPGRGGKIRLFNYLLCIAVIFLTQSKTIWALITLGMFLVASFGFLQRFAKTAFTSFFIGVSSVFYFTDLFDVLRERIVSGEFMTGRAFLWLYVLSHWWDNRLFGYGNALLRGEDREAFAATLRWTPAQAHNQWIHTLGQSGFVGFIGLSIYVYALVKAAVALAKPTGNWSIYMITILIVRTVSETPLAATFGTENFMLHLIVFGSLYLGGRHYATRPACSDEIVSGVPYPISSTYKER